MKDQFLKLAGVKSDKEFYKLFPDEKSFMAKYGKQVKKLNLGGAMQSLNKLAASNPVAVGVQSAGDIIGGIQQMKDDKQMMLGAQQMQGVSDVALQASLTRPEQVQRKYVRPEDNINTGGEFFPTYGVGTTIAKNGTEIANTFAPNTIYTNLEQAQGGFQLPKSNPDFMKFNKSGEQTDLFNFAEQGGGDYLSQMTAGLGSPKGYGTSGGGRVGKGIGSAAGTLIGGPVGGMIGGAVGQFAGNLLDRKAEKTEEAREATQKNIGMMAIGQGAEALQQQNNSYMKNGGIMNPQVINNFGGIPINQLLEIDPEMDTLRIGGNIRQENMAMGGDLKTHWGGYAEPMSINPYLPNGGETVMFRGKSHDESDGYGNTGIGITYGDNPVEVERGEPALQLKNGSDGSNSLTVYGNLKIPNYGVDLIGDPKAKGKKFKNYVSDLTRVENNQNKLMSKSVKGIDSVNESDPYDKLSFASYKSNMLGADMKLKDIAAKKINAANLQSAINDTAEEYQLVADDLAKGKVKVDKKTKAEQARFGKSVIKAQVGINEKLEYKNPGGQSTLPYNQMATEPLEYWKDDSTYSSTWTDTVKDLLKNRPGEAIQYFQNYEGPDKEDVIKTLTKQGSSKSEMINNIERLATDKKIGPYHEGLKRLLNSNISDLPRNLPSLELPKGIKEKFDKQMKKEFKKINSRKSKVDEKSNPDWMTYANQILPYLRPSDAEQLDTRQLAGEMYALSTNQLEPVQAQTYQPELSTPYDISFQDQLNANQDDYRAVQRMTGYNPAALAMLNSQKYAANQQVLGEQFRANQAMKDRVYGENRQLLNQAKLQNLGIYDQQYQRQEQAKSNTKATTQAALNSIASKYAQNQLENRTLQTYENMYNYRFDPRFRATNMNPLAQFNTDVVGGMTLAQLEEEVNRRKKEQKETKPENARNGSILKAFRS